MSKKNADPIADQGRDAAEQGIPSADCPYINEGDNRATWLRAHRDKTAELAAKSVDD